MSRCGRIRARISGPMSRSGGRIGAARIPLAAFFPGPLQRLGRRPPDLSADRDRHGSRRGVRVVEGARLESVYTAYTRIEGSNPSLSASFSVACIGATAAGRRCPVEFRLAKFNGVLCQSPASAGCEPRQARKGATVAVRPSAGVQLAGGTTLAAASRLQATMSGWGVPGTGTSGPDCSAVEGCKR